MYSIIKHGVNSNIDITDIDTVDVEENNTNYITNSNTDITYEFTQEFNHDIEAPSTTAILEAIQGVPTE